MLGLPVFGQAFPNLRPAPKLQNVSTGRVKFTRESNQSQDQQSVPHNLGEW